MINFPKNEKAVPVSKTINPVTQVAEVEVNKASRTPMECPVEEEMGKARKVVPRSMIRAKLIKITFAGWCLNLWINENAGLLEKTLSSSNTICLIIRYN